MESINLDLIKSKILEFRSQKVLLDNDVATFYGVDVKRVNEAVKNNPDKFPDGYILSFTNDEWNSLRSKFSTLKNSGRGQHRKYLPKAFTEKGLYMLATIIKSKTATSTTLLIIETFAGIRELVGTINSVAEQTEQSEKNLLLKKGGEIFSRIMDDNMQFDETESSIELNFAILKLKHTVKKKGK